VIFEALRWRSAATGFANSDWPSSNHTAGQVCQANPG